MYNYIELLKNPFWQRKRLTIFNRDNWKCVKCTDQFSNLQVHHLYYTKDALPWEYPDDALITVCALCHKKEEFYKSMSNFVLHLKSDKFTIEDIKSILEHIRFKLENNFHYESATRYMDDIKRLIHA